MIYLSHNQIASQVPPLGFLDWMMILHYYSHLIGSYKYAISITFRSNIVGIQVDYSNNAKVETLVPAVTWSSLLGKSLKLTQTCQHSRFRRETPDFQAKLSTLPINFSALLINENLQHFLKNTFREAKNSQKCFHSLLLLCL